MVANEDNKLVKCIYNLMLNDIEQHPTHQNWASSVRNLLSRLGFLDVWIAQTVGNIDAFLELCKIRLRDNFIQD